MRTFIWGKFSFTLSLGGSLPQGPVASKRKRATRAAAKLPSGRYPIRSASHRLLLLEVRSPAFRSAFDNNLFRCDRMVLRSC